jgi:hypothetical protein
MQKLGVKSFQGDATDREKCSLVFAIAHHWGSGVTVMGSGFRAA